jgi:hypothetical protein
LNVSQLLGLTDQLDPLTKLLDLISYHMSHFDVRLIISVKQGRAPFGPAQKRSGRTFRRITIRHFKNLFDITISQEICDLLTISCSFRQIANAHGTITPASGPQSTMTFIRCSSTRSRSAQKDHPRNWTLC